jgi:DnaA family protein
MSQLALDLLAASPPTLANFVAGRNAECVHRLRELAAGESSIRFVYLWGAPGSGRTHLLSALAASGRLLGPSAPPQEFTFDAACAMYAVDDVDALDAPRQQALFNLFIRAQGNGRAALVCSGSRPPLALPLREDLRTRLGSGLVFELQLLGDEDKAHALRALARERGVALAADVLPWLLTHRARDIRRLLAEFDAIDRFALERKRPITLALVREWLAQDPAPTGPETPVRG